MTNGEMLLIGLPASPLLAAVVLAWWGERGRGSTGAGITAAAGLVTAIAAASAVWLVDLPVTGEWAGGRFAFDHLTAAMIGALGLGVAWLGASALSATPERRCLLLLMLSTVVAFWLSDSLWLALGWQSLLLALAFLSLGCEADWPMAGPAARQLWLTTACADLALLLASVGWLLDASVATFSEAGTDSAVAEVAARSAASVTSIGTLVWLGSLGRMLQFPFGLFCDQSPHLPGRGVAAVFSLALAPVGWRWLAAAQPWLSASPETEQLVSAGSALGGGIAMWFAVCSGEARVRWCWLTAGQWSFAAAALLIPGPTGLWLSGLLLIAGTLSSLALLALWETPSPMEAAESDNPPEHGSPVMTWGAWHGGPASSGSWSRALHGTFRVWSEVSATVVPHHDRAARLALQDAAVRGGRTAVAACGVGLLAGPLLCVVASDAWGSDAAAWPHWLRLAALALGTLSVGSLIREIRADDRGLSLGEKGLLPMLLIAPWMLILPGPLRPLLVELPWGSPTSLAVIAVVATAAAVGGVGRSKLPGVHERTPVVGALLRLGRRRLYLPQLLLFSINLPTRGVAQLVRFLDWFVVDTVVLGGWKRLPRWGTEADLDLHHAPAGFYALSLCLSAAAVVLTLMTLAQ